MQIDAATTVGMRKSGSSALVILSALCVVVFLPTALRALKLTSSLTEGLVGACVVVAGLGILGNYGSRDRSYLQATLVIAAGATFVLLLHGLISMLWFGLAVGRAVGSLVILGLMIITAYQMRTILAAATAAALDRVLAILTLFFVLIAILSVLNIQPPIVKMFGKPIFPFTEPSHYALAVAPILIYQCVRARLPIRMLWLGGALGAAYLLENLTMVVAIAVAAACCLPAPWLMAGVVAVSVVAQGLDLTYFTDRLDFGTQTTNLSALVYIQGVELMEAAWNATSGWGIGFQQLGIAPINVPTSDLIYRLSQDDANLRDGGFHAAKLAAELGFIGVALVLGYLWLAVRAVMALRYQGAHATARDPLRLFVLSVIVAFALELFVRGLGYFSGNALLLLASLLLVAQGRFLRRPSPPERESRSCLV